MWIQASGRKVWFPTKLRTICSAYFMQDLFIVKKSGRRYLHPEPIPSINIWKCEKGLERFSDDVEEMLGFRPGIYWRICWKFISPTFIIGVVVFGLLYHQPLQYGDYEYPEWGESLGWGLALSSILMIPLLAVIQMIRAKGTCKQRFACCISPIEEHEDILLNKPVKRFTWRHWLYV